MASASLMSTEAAAGSADLELSGAKVAQMGTDSGAELPCQGASSRQHARPLATRAALPLLAAPLAALLLVCAGRSLAGPGEVIGTPYAGPPTLRTAIPVARGPPSPASPGPAPLRLLVDASPVQEEVELYHLLKQLRTQGFVCPHGRSFAPNARALAFDCRLWRAAQGHSAEMARLNTFDHIGADGGDPCDRTQAQGLMACSENIAAGQPTAAEALEAWKKSDGHCVNMLDPALDHMAIGFAGSGDSTYHYYWTFTGGNGADVDVSCGPPDRGGAPEAPATSAAPGQQNCQDLDPQNCPAFRGLGPEYCDGQFALAMCPYTCGRCPAA